MIICKGTGKHVLGNDSHDIKKGDVFVIHPDIEHCYIDNRGVALINVLFIADVLHHFFSDLSSLPGYHALFAIEPILRVKRGFSPQLHLNKMQLDKVVTLVAHIEKELHGQEPGSHFMAKTYFLELVGFLSRCYGTPEDAVLTEALQLAHVVTYMEQHIEQQITLDVLAQKATMSKRNLLRLFHNVMGTSPIDYLLKLRIKRSCELLQRPDTRIGEVAFAVGFSDSNYFSRQFKNVLGVSPREYRRRR